MKETQRNLGAAGRTDEKRNRDPQDVGKQSEGHNQYQKEESLEHVPLKYVGQNCGQRKERHYPVQSAAGKSHIVSIASDGDRVPGAGDIHAEKPRQCGSPGCG